jgi:hypothetical protein
MADVPWHLATGRLIVEHGVFPTTNTFSWTFPDYPLYQQYPLFQVMLYATWKVAGFHGLSVLTSILWTAVVAVWVRWGGDWRHAAILAPAWFIAVLGLQRHLLLRPEVLSLLFLGLLLLCLDGLRRDGRWGWVIGAVGVQWMWANSHQLFAIGLAVQLAFVVHLVMSRRLGARLGFSDTDRDIPLRKPLLLVFAGVLASCGTPLGVRSILIPFQSVGTLLTQGASAGSAQSAELVPVWTDPIARIVVLVGLGVLVYAAARSRGRWLWFEAAMLTLGLILVAAALRGIGFFSVLTIGVAARSLGRAPASRTRRFTVDFASVAVFLFCGLIVGSRFATTSSFLSIQPGTGRAIGSWPDATVDYLDAHRPEGRMLNIGWAAANVLIWEGFEVFVDPRWETYPKSFLLESIEAIEDPEVLAGQIREWQPSWIVAELRLPDVQERMAELVNRGEWRVVHADVLHLVLVKGAQGDTEMNAIGWHLEYPIVYAQEKIRVACWYEHRGRFADAQALRVEAEALGGTAISADLKRFGNCTGPDGKP